MSRVKIVVFVPGESAERVRQALGETGAGTIGEYSFCSFSVKGQGRFLPSNNANPQVGNKHEINTVEEERIEVVCNRADAKRIIGAMKQAHPYEEVAYDIYSLLNENEL